MADLSRDSVMAQIRANAAAQAEGPKKSFLSSIFGAERDKPKPAATLEEQSRREGYGMQGPTERKMREAGLEP